MDFIQFIQKIGFLVYPLFLFLILSTSLVIHLFSKLYFIQKKKSFHRNNFTEKLDASEFEDFLFLNFSPFQRKNLWLSRIASLSTMTGLLGTVIGIYNSFLSMKETGLASPEVFANGISEALLTTIFGLCIAIPSNLFFHLFEDWIEILIEKFTYEKI